MNHFIVKLTFSTLDLHLSLPSPREVTEGQTLILVCNVDGELKPTKISGYA